MSQGPNINPYASPQYSGPATANMMAGPGGGIFRQGDYLVFDKRIRLPDICLITNEPARERTSTNYQYLPPSVRWLGGGFGLIGAAIAQAFAVNATVEMPTSESLSSQRWNAILIGVGVAALGVVMFVVGLVFVEPVPALGVTLILGGLAAFIGGIIAGAILYKQVQPYFINETHIWLSGVHPDYLNRLPPWPHEPV